MRFMISSFVCMIFLGLGCSSSHVSSTPKATQSKSDLASWDKYHSKVLNLQFAKPAGRQNIQEGGQTLTMYLHGVSVATSFPSDTQYLITFSIEKYTKAEWESRFGNMTKVDPSLEEKARNDSRVREWLEFKKWFYSLNADVTMRNHQGRRYYRRSLIDKQGEIIDINTEYVPLDENTIAEDDAAIRRMMASVKLNMEVQNDEATFHSTTDK